MLAAAALVGGLASTASAQHAEHYVLDAYGGVHAGDGAPIISPNTPYFGWDVAIDIEYIPVGTDVATGDGILVLDRLGGVHNGGGLVTDPPGGNTPYFGFDAARAIVYRDVPLRVASGFAAGFLELNSSSYVTLASATIHAPDDGYLLVNGATNVFCSPSSETNGGYAGVYASLALDGTTPPTGLKFANRDWGCGGGDIRGVGGTHVFPVTAGSHTVNLVGRVYEITAQKVDVSCRSITVLFVDKNKFGES